MTHSVQSVTFEIKHRTIKKQPIVMHTTPTSYMNITKILQSYDPILFSKTTEYLELNTTRATTQSLM